MTKYYTTHEVAKLLPNYSNARTFLEALHNNQKLNKGKVVIPSTTQYILSTIWKSRFKLGKSWYYQKEVIDKLALHELSKLKIGDKEC